MSYLENNDRWGLQIIMIIIYLSVGYYLLERALVFPELLDATGVWWVLAGIIFVVASILMWSDMEW